MSSARRKCRGGCGNWLTDPDSLARGYGKRCAEQRGIPTGPASKPARTTPPVVPVPQVPGQTELPLQDHQPTLWSL